MSQKNPPSRKQNKRRGKKRNAAEQLSTTNNNRDNDIGNPRPAKRRRKDLDDTIQQLLTLSIDQLSKLPETLKKQAIALRSARNIDNGQNNNNNIHQNNEFQIEEVDDDSEDDDDDEYDDDRDEDDDTEDEEQDNQNERVAPNPFIGSNQNNSNIINQYPYNPNISRLNESQSYQSYPGLNRFLPQYQHQNQHQHQHQHQHQYQYQYDKNNYNINPRHKNENNMSPNLAINDVISENEENVNANPDKTQKRSCFVQLLWIMLFIIIIITFVITIPFSNSNGLKYCDKNSDIIKEHENIDCIQCPMNAINCVYGRAKCEDISYWIDPDLNECVKWNFKKIGVNFLNLIKNIGYKSSQCIYGEVMKWIRIKEWKKWFNNLINMEWKAFCKNYEMEIMVWFFILSWYLPLFRSLIIFFWSTMLLPTMNNDDDKIKICIKLLRYFSPLMFGFEIWNKMAAFVS